MAEDRELGHRRLEARGHELLLINETLPEAGGTRVPCEGEVGLQAHLSGVGPAAEGQGRRNLAGIAVGSAEAGALEQHLKEHLSVESERSLWMAK